MEIRSPETDQEWKAYFHLRYEVLRAPWNQPKGSERSPEDPLALHLAWFEKGEILGILRLDTFQNETVAQIRFMAVANKQQGKGIGKKLMLHAEELTKGKNFQSIMLQARDTAIPFYQSLGYSLVQKSYLLFDTIQHYEMRKDL
jgi:predicted GNAT family N-acyltransferase